VADTSEKSRPRWRKALAWFGVKLAEHALTYVVGLLTVGVGAAWVLGWLTGMGRFLISDRTISAWLLGILVVAALGFGVGAVALFHHNRQLRRAMALPKGTRPPFQPIEVNDERLHLRWFIRQPPELWLHYQDVQHTLSPPAVQQILDGPFHAVCLERVMEQRSGYGEGHSSPILLETCPGCGAHLFTTPHRNLEATFAYSWTVRAQAVQELQRMHRKRIPIEGPRLVLENPLYWGDMEAAWLAIAPSAG
jgi:hypothetical protein